MKKRNNKQRMRARKPAARPTGMTATQREYSEIAETLRQEERILQWRFEAVRLQLPDDSWYCPHFYVRHPNGDVEFVDVPRKNEVGAFLARQKLAVEGFPTFVFTVAHKTGGEWTTAGCSE